MIENYLQVLEESLLKKKEVLLAIEEMNREQEQILKDENPSMEAFDESIDKKGLLIEELSRLDDGFETLYEHIKEQLLHNKDEYKGQIARLQKLIAEVTDKSVTIQAQEARNKKSAEKYFAKARRELKSGRVNSKAALDYYLNMNKAQIANPQFIDKKK
ncbi:MAG: flagellar protein FliT [Clostridiales bacterium]|nr:flagellar protein FliT [Clostridiales bacterium]